MINSQWFPAGGGAVRVIAGQGHSEARSVNFIWNFNSFGLVYVLTQGGPGGETRLPTLFAYEEAFRYGQFGYAAAMGLVMIAVVAVLLTVFLRNRLTEVDR